MPTHPITHEPSFDATVYPFQMVFTLSTSTLPSTLTLPCYQANFPSDIRQPESNRVKEDDVSQAHPGNSSWEEVANPIASTNAVKNGISQVTESLRENLNLEPVLPILHSRKDPPLPVFQEKPIYKRGKFKWATSFGQGPIDHPPFPPSDARLSEGDVFIWVDIASTPSRVQVWCSFTTPSVPCLIWRPITMLEDIRVIDDTQYLLSLSKNTEPSWILVKSAMDLRMVAKTKQSKQFKRGVQVMTSPRVK